MLTYILLVLGLLSLTVFLLFRNKEGGIPVAALKTLTSLLFVATAVSAAINNYIVTGTLSASKLTFMGLVILGLVCGLIGDLTLDLKVTYKTLNIHHSDLDTYFGMAAFAIGHVLYVVACALYFGFTGWEVLIAAAATALIILGAIFVMKMTFGKFLIPTVVYTFLLTLFVATTVAAGVLTAFTVPVILLVSGSALFLASDLVLSMIYFDGNESRLLIVVNHVLYYLAQFAIALSLYYVGVTL